MSTKIIKNIEYLYGIKSATWKCLNYAHALQVKNELAHRVIGKLLAKPYDKRTNADSYRVTACLKAIKFNEGLLNE